MMKNGVLNTVFTLTLVLGIQFSNGQTTLKPLPTMEDYDKWSTLTQEKIAPDGKWIAYTLKYDSGLDTLFIKNTATSRQHSFPKGRNAVFSGDSKWLSLHQQDGIVLLDLKTGKERSVPDAVKTDFNVESEYLVTCIRKGDTQQLLLLDLKKGTEQKILEIKEYTISPDGKLVGFITQDNSVQVIRLGQNTPQTLMVSIDTVRKHLVWNDTATAVAFLEEIPSAGLDEGNHKIYLIAQLDKNQKVWQLDPTVQQGRNAGYKIHYNPSLTPLLIAPDTQKVFFYVQGEKPMAEENGVEVWHSQDKLEYQRALMAGYPASRPKLSIWWPETGKIEEISTHQHPAVYLTPDRNKAIVFDPHQYEPQKEIMGPADLWLKDLNTGKNKLLLKKQSGKVGRLGVSPNSRYLNYYREKHWWVYNMELDKHILLTKGMKNLENTDTYPGGEPPPFGFAGWSKDSQFLIIHSQYDVWLIAADGTSKERLTNGETERKRFRVVNNLTGKLKSIHMYDFMGHQFDLKQGLILEAFNTLTKASGYYHWPKKKKLSRLIFKDARLNRIKKAEQSDAFIVIEQKAAISPKIVFLEGSKKERAIVKTNTHQEQFAWTKAELISYTNSKGVPLQGVLQYPAGFEPGKQYPMIVYIYEDQSDLLHYYYNPGDHFPAGFSPANYTSEGYFVLYPDIVYTAGRPGFSAVDCVEAAVAKVLERGFIDKNLIGLFGHSFGGYQTSFIITQTDLFAAAVAGAAITDFVAHALTLEEATGRSQMWRYQTHQMRMGKSLYEDYQGFVDNSPITHAHLINTPLLSWTGKMDYQVDPQQSMALHLALRSLRKNNTLLLYPDEAHVLLRPEFQKDLTVRIKKWFDHYLKNISGSGNY